MHASTRHYLNYAGTSWPKAPGAVEAMRVAAELSPAALLAPYERAKARLAAFWGTRAVDRLRITSGCTAALDLVLSALPWREGDRLVTSSLEHHALARVAEALERTRGVIHHRLPYRAGVGADPQEFRELLRQGPVRALALCSASNLSGELLPLAELGAIARTHGSCLVVDYAQTAGLCPIHLDDGPADIAVFAAHKAMLAPMGVGALWARPGVELELAAASCEVPAPGSPPKTGACGNFFDYCDAGSVNIPALVAWAQAADWVVQHAPPGDSTPGRALAKRFAETIGAAHPHWRILGDPGAERSCAVGLVPRSAGLEGLQSAFERQGLQLRVGQHCAPMGLEALGVPQGCLRVSFGAMSESAALDRALELFALPPDMLVRS